MKSFIIVIFIVLFVLSSCSQNKKFSYDGSINWNTTSSDIIKKYGTKCAVTDFSIFLGVAYSDNNYTKDGKDTKDKKERSGWWWTRTPYLESPSRVYVVGDYGGDDDDAVYERYNGGRPVLPYSLIKAISSNEVIGKYGIKEVKYGEYPQTIVDETLSKELEKCYNEDVPFEVDLVKSGKVYKPFLKIPSYNILSFIKGQYSIPLPSNCPFEISPS